MASHQSCSAGSDGSGAHRQLIARGAFSAVETCRCGAVYLTIGPVSLRVDPSALSELGELISQASFILSEQCKPLNSGSASEPGEAPAAQRGGSDSERSVEPSPPNKLN
jgi:hypothetical protein